MTGDTIGTSVPIFKLCRACDQEKPATTEFFAPSKQFSLGLHCWCRCCAATKRAERESRASQTDQMPSLMKRFEANVLPEPNSGCWLWGGAYAKANGHGYLACATGTNVSAARLSWQIHRGEIPGNLCVHHRCGNYACVNPGHLFLGAYRRPRLSEGQHRANFEASYIPEPNSGCWLWLGPYSADGWYGSFSAGRKDSAHRHSWRMYRGEIPDGLCVCHHCDNPVCVNPDHLFLGTQNDNVQDCVRKGRRKHKSGREYPNARRGELCNTAKLTAKDVALIRRLPIKGVEAASMFGISASVVSKIRLRQIWRSVE